MKILWSSKLKHIREKKGEKVYHVVIQSCLRTPQTSSKNPFRLNAMKETRGKMDTWIIKSGSWKKSKTALAFFWRQTPHLTCKIYVIATEGWLQYLHLTHLFSKYISTTENELCPFIYSSQPYTSIPSFQGQTRYTPSSNMILYVTSVL